MLVKLDHFPRNRGEHKKHLKPPAGLGFCLCSRATLPKTNMEPQNEGLEDEFPFQMGDFQVPC